MTAQAVLTPSDTVPSQFENHPVFLWLKQNKSQILKTSEVTFNFEHQYNSAPNEHYILFGGYVEYDLKIEGRQSSTFIESVSVSFKAVDGKLATSSIDNFFYSESNLESMFYDLDQDQQQEASTAFEHKICIHFDNESEEMKALALKGLYDSGFQEAKILELLHSLSKNP